MMAGVLYHDGQFDDSRLAINLVRTAVDAGACVLNYMNVISLLKEAGKVSGVQVRDEETGAIYSVKARSVINATGVFADDILQMDKPENRPTVASESGSTLDFGCIFPGERLCRDDPEDIRRTCTLCRSLA